MPVISYSPDALQNIRQHITQHMGDAQYYMQMCLDNGMLVEVDVVRPTTYRNFYTLVTVGLGAYLNQTAEMDGCVERCELTFYLPANWGGDDNADWNEESRKWPVDLLKLFIEKAVVEGVGLNSLVDNGEPFGPNTKQSAAMLIEQVEDDMKVCYTPEGDVTFLSIFVVYAEEADFFTINGQQLLMQKVEDDLEIIQVAPLCLDRKNVLSPNNKQFWLSHESQILSDWEDGPYCYASDGIMVDGKPIAYCYRMEPDETDTLGWDSGWRFFADGDDVEALTANRKLMGNFELNTLCNVDSLILPLLHAPFGSAFRREPHSDFVFERGPFIPNQTRILTDDVRKKLTAMPDEDPEGFVGMVKFLREYLHKGMDAGKFTLEDVRKDLEISLWYGYASINSDSYEHNYEAMLLMPSAENYALGCGRWYYRYACALTNCGRLKKALRYAEYGAVMEPEYPWIWLKLGRLRAHFGDKEGALEAVEKGLALEPGNYEFTTLQHEIMNGATLEQMELHVIDPEADLQLQDGTLPSYKAKKRVVDGMVCNEHNLAQVKAMFKPMSDWTPDAPYCSFSWNLTDEPLVMGFGMNEAALSKIDLNWLWALREKLDSGRYRRQVDPKGVETTLVTVMVGWNHHVDLIYQYPDSTKLLRVPLTV